METQGDVQEFFDHYANALSSIDLDALADCYHYPSLAVTRMGCQAITDPEQTRQFFQANGQQYYDQGIVAVQIVGLQPGYDERGLWIGQAELQNLDDSGRQVGVEHNAYQLVKTVQGWRIAVTTPLDAG